MRVTYFGHSCFLVETRAARLILDPFLTGNPVAPVKESEVSCDFVLCSHGHIDHTCDALAIAKRCRAQILAPYELAEFFARRGANAAGLNPGGSGAFPFGRLKLTLAHHSSSWDEDGTKDFPYLGNPCGLLIQSDGKTIYHAGDTALFLDMQLIGRAGIDLAMLPIGDFFTMGPEDALDALDLLKPRLAVPIHYNTWPRIAQDGGKFAADAAARGHRVKALKPGESIEV